MFLLSRPVLLFRVFCFTTLVALTLPIVALGSSPLDDEFVSAAPSNSPPTKTLTSGTDDLEDTSTPSQTQKPTQTSWLVDGLPDEILILMFWYLPPSDLWSVKDTCYTFRRVALDPLFLRKKVKREFPNWPTPDFGRISQARVLGRMIQHKILDQYIFHPNRMGLVQDHLRTVPIGLLTSHVDWLNHLFGSYDYFSKLDLRTLSHCFGVFQTSCVEQRALLGTHLQKLLGDRINPSHVSQLMRAVNMCSSEKRVSFLEWMMPFALSCDYKHLMTAKKLFDHTNADAMCEEHAIILAILQSFKTSQKRSTALKVIRLVPQDMRLTWLGVITQNSTEHSISDFTIGTLQSLAHRAEAILYQLATPR